MGGGEARASAGKMGRGLFVIVTKDDVMKVEIGDRRPIFMISYSYIDDQNQTSAGRRKMRRNKAAVALFTEDLVSSHVNKS